MISFDRLWESLKKRFACTSYSFCLKKGVSKKPFYALHLTGVEGSFIKCCHMNKQDAREQKL
jgi:hypothetical protein